MDGIIELCNEPVVQWTMHTMDYATRSVTQDIIPRSGKMVLLSVSLPA